MKNNGRVCDVDSLTIHWNISEMIYLQQVAHVFWKSLVPLTLAIAS